VLAPAEFVDPLERFCRGAGIRTKKVGGQSGARVDLIGVQLESADQEERTA
jgi:hypothetical protein